LSFVRFYDDEEMMIGCQSFLKVGNLHKILVDQHKLPVMIGQVAGAGDDDV
jgi:hypothetical protein